MSSHGMTSMTRILALSFIAAVVAAGMLYLLEFQYVPARDPLIRRRSEELAYMQHVAAGIRRYTVDHGVMPATLDDLTTPSSYISQLYLPFPGSDPRDYPLKYVTRDGEWRLLGRGTDGVFQITSQTPFHEYPALTYDPHNGTLSPGDIVFSGSMDAVSQIDFSEGGRQNPGQSSSVLDEPESGDRR
jgi:hypothetical protein